MSIWKYRKVYYAPLRNCYFYWRGAAADLAFEIMGSQVTVQEATLMYKEGCNFSAVQYVYRYFESDFEGSFETPLFTSKADLREYMLEKEIEEIDCGSVFEFESSVYKPSLPDESIVQIQRNRKGDGFCAYISRNVEEYGRYGRKKVFFPDKTWKDVKEGRARVKVTKEFDSYGFITGEMLLDHPVSVSRALDFFEELNDSVCNPETMIYSFVDAHTGEIAWGYALDKKICAAVVTDAVSGKDTVLNNPMEQVNQTLIWSGPLYCAMAQYDWDIDAQELEDIMKSLVPSKYYRDYLSGSRAVINSLWSDCNNPDFVDTLVDEAFDTGIIKCVCVERTPNIQVYELCTQGFKNLTNFSKEEISNIFRLCSKVNKAADDKISSLIKKGVLRPRAGWRRFAAV